jgi:hypothetical protein
MPQGFEKSGEKRNLLHWIDKTRLSTIFQLVQVKKPQK